MCKIYTILEIVCFLLCLEYFKMSDRSNSIQVIIIYIGVVCILYFLQKKKITTFVKEKDSEIRCSYRGDYDNLLSSVRKRQHEFQNHLQAIVGMCYSVKNYEALVQMQQTYIGQIIARNVEYKLLNCEWKILSGFLYSKINEAWNKGITIKYDVNITKPITTVPEFVMVELVGILLDNAIEAVESLGESVIYIWIKEIKGSACFSVSNPVSSFEDYDMDNIFEKGYSSKEGHSGYGLSKVREYSKTYQFEYTVMKTVLDGKEHFSFVVFL